jgi:hypothetical protein
VQEVTFGQYTYKVYRNPGSGYLAFVVTTNFTSGTVDLLEIMKWAIAKGWLPGNSTLNQICLGVEVVSTDDADATFHVTGFAIDAKLRPRFAPQGASDQRDQQGAGEQPGTEDSMSPCGKNASGCSGWPPTPRAKGAALGGE